MQVRKQIIWHFSLDTKSSLNTCVTHPASFHSRRETVKIFPKFFCYDLPLLAKHKKCGQVVYDLFIIESSVIEQ